MSGTGVATGRRKTFQRRNSMHLCFDQQYEVAPSGCWIWKRFLNSGYGVVKIGTRSVKAHRYSYERAFGPIPEGAVVRHKCDITACVNPEHLEIGSQADNVRDAVERGRAKGAPGVRNAKAKLTPEQVTEIRRRSEAGESRVSLAAEFRVAPTMISNIALGLNWRHIPEDACL